MLRVTIVGCGKIADQHVHAIRRIPDCSIVAVCDQEPLMAQQLAERFKIPGVFSNAHEMLKAVSPDVVHITTPPQSHYSLAKECLDAGSHVYLEKPFTVTSEEAESLIELAERKNVRITAGHNLQFTLEMLEMRRLIKEGLLGGEPAHLESYFSYDLGDATYAKGLLQNQSHWVRKLPGGLLHNIISHGVAKLAEFLDDDLTDIKAIGGQSPRLKSLGDERILDELRVLLRDKTGRTASFCFSTQLKGLNQLRLYGPEGSIAVDHSSGSVVRNKNRPCKSYLTYFIPPLRAAGEHLRNARVNVTNFVRQRLHQDSGMKELIERFYNSVRFSSPPPIPYREIILTARIMDEIFAQIYGGRKPEASQNTVKTRRNATPFDIPLSVIGHSS
ncbi:MAG TPA: Gfo/Idh/MocA family oxidoreductase [Candidatus Udaeobacter sp.]